MPDTQVYFYQQKGHKRHIKRFKKLPEQLPASLRHFLQANYKNKRGVAKNDKTVDDQDDKEGETSLAAKLAELAEASGDNFDSMSQLSQRGKSGMTNVSQTNPYSFMDTKIAAMKQITENLLFELQEYLTRFDEVNMRPVLSGTIIYELHADWSDLTLNCSYENFPQWRTKIARDLALRLQRSEQRRARNSDQDDETCSISSATSRRSSRLNSGSSVGNTSYQQSIEPSLSSTRKNTKHHSLVPSRLDPISEEKHALKNKSMLSEYEPSIAGSLKSEHIKTSIQFNLDTNRKTNKNKLTAKIQTNSNSIFDTTRQTINSSIVGGSQVSFQLSSKLCEDKGWTILTDRVTLQPIDFERRVFRALNKSLREINELKAKNERLSLNKSCKIRYYGDHKKETLEKYKHVTLKPKKSQFAMAILRRELPKPLEINVTIDAPLPPTASLPSTSNEVFSQSKIICSTQTNDGTQCIFYPNGRIAILKVTVFGFTAEQPPGLNQSQTNSSSNTSVPQSSTLNTSQSQQQQQQQQALLNNFSVSYHSIIDSYTTLIFDDIPLSRDDSKLGYPNLKLDGHVANGRLLAVINASGGCVMYRKNGVPKFICNESGGLLLDKKGISLYTWKWDDLKDVDRERLKRNLNLNLNDSIHLDYKSPFDILVTFNSNREQIRLHLGAIKGNLAKIYELFSRISCDCQLQSKASNAKISKTTKGAIVQSYKQQHIQSLNQNQLQIAFNGKYLTSQLVKESQENKLLERLFENSISYKDIPLMKDLFVIQKRVRTLLDEWLIYCRHTLGVLKPEMYILSGYPSPKFLDETSEFFDKILLFKRKSKSAELLNYTNAREHNHSELSMSVYKRSHSALMNRQNTALNKSLPDYKQRISALRRELSYQDLLIAIDKPLVKKRTRNVSTACTRDKPSVQSIILNALVDEKQSPTKSNTYSTEEQCPYALHQKVLFNRKADCKCKRNRVPTLSDLIFDRFLRNLPAKQLLVVVVIDSNDSVISNTQNLISQLYDAYNENRSKPCIQSYQDDVRFVFYDVQTATHDSNHTNPLLIQRHNVMSGMCLIYLNGKLLFCDHIFNGYGSSLNDFIKQINQSKQDANEGKYLPSNFRFFRPKHGPFGHRTPWGGEIGGLVFVEKESTLFENKNYFTQSLDSFSRAKRLHKENTFLPKDHFVLPKINKKSTLEV